MEELFTNAIARVPAMENAEVKAFFNGPEAFTPDADFLLGETDVPGLLDRRGRLRARSRRRRRGRQGHERVDRRRPSRVGRLAARLAPLRPAVPQPRVHARAHLRGAVAVLRHQVPGRGAEGRAAHSVYRRYISGISRWTRPSGRRAAGSASTGTSRMRRAATSRCGRAAGRARTGRLRSRSRRGRRARRSRCSTSRRSRRSRCSGPGALAFLERLCGNRIDRPVGTVVYTQLLNRRGGIEADLSVMRRGEDRFLLVTGTAFGTHDRAWLESNMPRDGSVYVNDVTSELRLPLPLGAEGARGRRASTTATCRRAR